MVWPVRAANSSKVAGSSGAEPETNRRIVVQVRGAEAGLGEQARIKRRHTHHDRRVRQRRDHAPCVEFGVPKHACARQQGAVTGHEQAMHVIQRQRVQQHVVVGKAPAINQRQGVAGEVAMRQHRALGAPGRAGGVEDGRQVIRGATARRSNNSSWSRAASSSVPWFEASVNTVASRSQRGERFVGIRDARR